MEESDLEFVAALMNRAYRGSTIGWHSEAGIISGNRTTAALLREEMLANPHASFLKLSDPALREPLGCVWLEPLAQGTWYLGSLATSVKRQKEGLGGMLLRAAEDWIWVRGGTRVRMTVINVRAGLIAWYLRRGYSPTGDTEPFPYGDTRFGEPMRDDLEFVVLEKNLARRTS